MKRRIISLLLTLISVQLTLSAQTDKRINLEFQNEALPTVLKKLEQASDYRILFTYDDVQPYHVTAALHDATIIQAVEKVLEGKPLTYTQKENRYLIILSNKEKKTPVAIRGTVIDEKNNPMPFCNVLLLTPDSTFVNGCVTKEDGSFLMAGVEGIPYLLKASYVGYITTTEALETQNLIQLLPDTQTLGEVTVTGSVPTFNMKNGNIVANVSSTILGKETKVMDVLRKIPGMTMQDGKLISYTGGTPLVYVNGKKLQSIDDVKRLEVKNIKHVELITNPGAEYDASVNAVLLITTLKRLEGWSVQLEGELSRNHRWSNEESMKLNYQTGGLNLFGTFTYGDYRRKSHQLMKTVITTPDTIWTQTEDLTSENKIRMYQYSAGGDYSLNDRHSIGVEYNGYYMDTYAHSPSRSTILANEKAFDRIESLSILEDNGNYYHHLNGYYSGRFSPKTKLDIYADYVHTHNGRNQVINENSDLSGSAQIVNHNGADYHVYAVSPKFSYLPNKSHSLVIGGEWSRVTGKNSLKYEGLEDNDASSETEEEKLAAFLSYRYSLGQFSMNAGLRYENVLSDL